MKEKIDIKLMKRNISYFEQEIEKFKREVKRFTKWKSGRHILGFITIEQAFYYGNLIGKRDILTELIEEAKEEN